MFCLQARTREDKNLNPWASLGSNDKGSVQVTIGLYTHTIFHKYGHSV
jgi:hypothetical protein